MRSSYGLLGCLGLACLLISARLHAEQPQGLPSPAAAWQRLKDGNARFSADKAAGPHRDVKRRQELARGQSPFAVVLSCADSRVVPELLFDQGLGDVFVLRLAGNVAEPGVIGSMEFAVGELKTPLIVVLGHTECGAVKAALSGETIKGDLGKLVQRVKTGPAAAKDKAGALDAAVAANARAQARHLTEQSPLLRDAVGSGRLQIVAGVYRLDSGTVQWVEIARTPAK
jgi:carbonic anhydrase